MRTYTLLAITSVIMCLLGSELVWAQHYSDKEKAELARALSSAKVPLETALLVSEREGISISAGFEMEKGELNLWVFVKKGEQFLAYQAKHAAPGSRLKRRDLTSLLGRRAPRQLAHAAPPVARDRHPRTGVQPRRPHPRVRAVGRTGTGRGRPVVAGGTAMSIARP